MRHILRAVCTSFPFCFRVVTISYCTAAAFYTFIEQDQVMSQLLSVLLIFLAAMDQLAWAIIEECSACKCVAVRCFLALPPGEQQDALQQ